MGCNQGGVVAPLSAPVGVVLWNTPLCPAGHLSLKGGIGMWPARCTKSMLERAAAPSRSPHLRGRCPAGQRGAIHGKASAVFTQITDTPKPHAALRPVSPPCTALGRGAGKHRDRVKVIWRFPAPRSAVYARTPVSLRPSSNLRDGVVCLTGTSRLCNGNTSSRHASASHGGRPFSRTRAMRFCVSPSYHAPIPPRRHACRCIRDGTRG
jgi:hypothetical protein